MALLARFPPSPHKVFAHSHPHARTNATEVFVRSKTTGRQVLRRPSSLLSEATLVASVRLNASGRRVAEHRLHRVRLGGPA